MKVAHRIGAGFGLLVALMIGVLAYHAALVQRLIDTQQNLSATTVRAATAATTLERQCDTVLALTRKVFELQRRGEPLPDEPLLPDYLSKLEAERAVIGDTLADLESMELSADERQAVVQLLHTWRAHLAGLRHWTSSAPEDAALNPRPRGPSDPAAIRPTTIDVPAPATVRASSNTPAGDSTGVTAGAMDGANGSAIEGATEIVPTEAEAIPTLVRLTAQSRALRQATDNAIGNHLSAAEKAGKTMRKTNSLVLLAALVMSLVVGFVTVRSITRPLGRLIDATRAVANGRFFYQLDASRNDELGRVAAAFNTMTRRLEAFDRMKRDFVARVSHDLRTPLVAMQETNDVLLSPLVGPLNERQQRLVHLNRQGAKRLTTRIGHLLDLARLEAGVLELDTQRHDLVRLVQETLDGIEGRLKHRDITLRHQLPSKSLGTQCDGERLTEVLENVLDNAIKFSPTGASIEVSLALTTVIPDHLPRRWRSSLRPGLDGALALITVTDEGPGLADADKGRIFLSFFRANHNERPKTTGVGLGLAICHDLVRAHHGAIWVTDNPGGGSCFHIMLPTTQRGSSAPEGALRTAVWSSTVTGHGKTPATALTRTPEAAS